LTRPSKIVDHVTGDPVTTLSHCGQVAVGVYPDGEIKHKCLSRGYTAWWQRKTYFTFLTAYILVIPALVICFCYFNVVRVVWQQGKEVQKTASGQLDGIKIAAGWSAKCRVDEQGKEVSMKRGVALRKTVKNERFLVRAKIKSIKVRGRKTL